MSDVAIEVMAPAKTASSYLFSYDIRRPSASVAGRVRRIVNPLRGIPLAADRRRFGFVASNFNVQHCEFWDSVYPLLHLTRQGGPIFDQGFGSARIVLRYPAVPGVVRFFEERAGRMGLELHVDADGETAGRLIRTDSGVTLGFGGGKDSRLLLGLLREFEESPTPFQSGFPIGIDIDGLRVSEAVSFGLADHVMPGLMSAGTAYYFGGGIGEAHRTEPWHRHYDFGSPRAIGQLSEMMRQHGGTAACHSPLAALPYNLIQKILAVRYPRLYAFQHSVVPNEATEKNLHVALCRLYHGLDPTDSCSETMFRSLLRRFVDHQLADPDDFGFRSYRRPIRLEMRSIVQRLRDHDLVSEVARRVPDTWAAGWIDYFHPYVVPDLDPRLLNVFRQYADEVPASEDHIAV